MPMPQVISPIGKDSSTKTIGSLWTEWCKKRAYNLCPLWSSFCLCFLIPKEMFSLKHKIISLAYNSFPSAKAKFPVNYCTLHVRNFQCSGPPAMYKKKKTKSSIVQTLAHLRWGYVETEVDSLLIHILRTWLFIWFLFLCFSRILNCCKIYIHYLIKNKVHKSWNHVTWIRRKNSGIILGELPNYNSNCVQKPEPKQHQKSRIRTSASVFEL